MSERESASQETETDKHVEDSSSSRERRSNKMSASKRSNRLKLGPRRKARSSDSSPGKEMFEKMKFLPGMGTTSQSSEKASNGKDGISRSNGVVRNMGPYRSPLKDHSTKSMLNDTVDDASSGRRKQSPKLTGTNVRGEEVRKETWEGTGKVLEYKSNDSDEDATCAAEDLNLNLAIQDFTGELLMPDEATQGIKLRDDLIIPCECANPDPNKDPSNNSSNKRHRDLPAQNQSQVASNKSNKDHDKLKDQERSSSIHNTSNTNSEQIKTHSSRMAPRVLCSDDGITVDWTYANPADDRSPQDDFSISSTGSDSLLFDSKKPKPASGLIRLAKAEKGVFIPPQIVRTDDEGTNTNEEADSEAAFSGEKQDMGLRRRHRAAGNTDVKNEIKHKAKGDRLSVKVVHTKESSCESEADTGPNTPISLRVSSQVIKKIDSL